MLHLNARDIMMALADMIDTRATVADFGFSFAVEHRMNLGIYPVCLPNKLSIPGNTVAEHVLGWNPEKKPLHALHQKLPLGNRKTFYEFRWETKILPTDSVAGFEATTFSSTKHPF